MKREDVKVVVVRAQGPGVCLDFGKDIAASKRRSLFKLIKGGKK